MVVVKILTAHLQYCQFKTNLFLKLGLYDTCRKKCSTCNPHIIDEKKGK